MVQVVLPNDANPLGFILGGTVMHLIDIAGAIAESGTTIDKRTIVVGNPIKSLGAHQVTVKVHDEVDANVQLNVVPA